MLRPGSFFAEGSLIVEAVLNWLLKTCCFPIVDLLYVEMMWLAIPALENLSSELLIMYHSSAKEMERKPFQAVLFLLPLKEPTVLLLSLILLSFPWNSLQTSAASYEQGINGFIFHSVQRVLTKSFPSILGYQMGLTPCVFQKKVRVISLARSFWARSWILNLLTDLWLSPPTN